MLEPDPVDFMSTEAGEKKMVTEGGMGPGGERGGKGSLFPKKSATATIESLP